MTSIEQAEACALCGSVERIPFFEENGFPVVRCASCSLLYCYIRPSQDAVGRMYDDEQWVGRDGESVRDDSTYGLFDEARRREADEKVAHLVRYVTPLGKLLDVGCGVGHLLESARRRGFEVEGVELSAARATLARQRGLTVHRGEIQTLELPQGQWDVITCINVLSHVADPMGFLAALSALLRPGGLLLLETGNKAELVSFRDGTVLSDFWGAPGHLFFFGEEQLRKAIAAASLHVRAVTRSPYLDLALSPRSLGRGARKPAARAVLRWIGPFRWGLKIYYRRRRLKNRQESCSLIAVAERPASGHTLRARSHTPSGGGFD